MKSILLFSALVLATLGHVSAKGYADSCTVKTECMGGDTDATCESSRCDCKFDFTICKEGCYENPKALGEKCTRTLECQMHDSDSRCSTPAAGETMGVCECRPPQVRSGFECVKAKCVIGGACDNTVSVQVDYVWSPNTVIHTCNSSKMCQCAACYTAGSDKASCVPDAKNVGDNCTCDIQCPDNSLCKNSPKKCVCDDGYAGSGATCSIFPVSINESCYIDEQCPGHFHWNGTQIDVGNCPLPNNCTCYTGYSWDVASSTCKADQKTIYQYCDIDYNCPGNYFADGTETPDANMNCVGSVPLNNCTCDPGYLPNTGMDKCVLDEKTIYSYCDIDRQCPKHIDGSIDGNGFCNGNNCSCGLGYVWGTSNCEIDPKNYGDACEEDPQCDLHTGGGDYLGQRFCDTSVCICKPEYVNASSGDCELKTGYLIGDACVYNDQCAVARSSSEGPWCSGGFCSCILGYTRDSARSTCVLDQRELGQNCYITEQCTAKTTNSECGRDVVAANACPVCVCQRGYQRVGRSCQAVRKNLNEYCYVNAECDGNTQTCKNWHCQCGSGYKLDDSMTSCVVDKKMIDDTCAKTMQCPSQPFSSCAGGRCTCNDGYKASTDKASCAIDKKTDGEACKRDFQCPFLASCKAGKCDCFPGVFYANMSSCGPLLTPTADKTCDKGYMCPPFSRCLNKVCTCEENFAKDSMGFCGREIGTRCESADDCKHITFAACSAGDGNAVKTCLCANGTIAVDSPAILEEACSSGAEQLVAIVTPVLLLTALLSLLH